MFYADPVVDMHNRMKEALVLLGKLPRAVVRPPLVKISDAEIARIREALIEAGRLLDTRTAQGARRGANRRLKGHCTHHKRRDLRGRHGLLVA